MVEKIQIKAVEMMRRIRDEQAKTLSGRSNEEIIAFFKKAGETARRKASRRSVQQASSGNSSGPSAQK